MNNTLCCVPVWAGPALLVCLLCLVGLGGSREQVGVRMAVTGCLECRSLGEAAEGLPAEGSRALRVRSCLGFPQHSSIPQRFDVVR